MSITFNKRLAKTPDRIAISYTTDEKEANKYAEGSVWVVRRREWNMQTQRFITVLQRVDGEQESEPQPLNVTLLEQRAKADARGMQPGWAEHDGVSCHYYPRSKSCGWWIYSVKRTKAEAVAHFRFQESFRKQA